MVCFFTSLYLRWIIQVLVTLKITLIIQLSIFYINKQLISTQFG